MELSVSNLLRFPTTIATLKVKLGNQDYNVFEEFLRDILDIGHNLGLVFGRHSAEFEATNYLFADAQFEIGEIKTCRDCYRHSNEKFDTLWFTVPCATRTHELVYAKSPGFPYWPAKVVKINEDEKYDVRFFGGEHLRAIVAKGNIEPIHKSIKVLNKRNTSDALQKAMTELKKHQERMKIDKNSFTFEAEKEIRDNNTCKYVPNKTPVSVKKRNQRSDSLLTTRNMLNQSNSSNTSVSRSKPCPLQKKSSNDIKAQNEVKPKESLPIQKTSPKKVPVKHNIIRKESPIVGPAPKRVKLERERMLQEQALQKKSENLSRPVTSHAVNHKEAIKHPALVKLDTRLMFAKSVEEAHQVAIDTIEEEITGFQKEAKKMEAKHKEELREAKRKQWVSKKNARKHLNACSEI